MSRSANAKFVHGDGIHYQGLWLPDVDGQNIISILANEDSLTIQHNGRIFIGRNPDEAGRV